MDDRRSDRMLNRFPSALPEYNKILAGGKASSAEDDYAKTTSLFHEKHS